MKEFIFTIDFLGSLSDWQNGWKEDQDKRRKIADQLVSQCQNLPIKFRNINEPCYRKRFINDGEVVSIVYYDNFFEGIASWTTNLNCGLDFKEMIRPDKKFAALFKHTPTEQEVIVNIIELWKDKDFVSAAEKVREDYPEKVKALFHFRDKQSEIILKSTLKGSEIENIVGISSSFDVLCDMAGIPEEEREKLSKEYVSNPDNILISIPIYASNKATRNAVKKAIARWKEKLSWAERNNIPIDWSNVGKENLDDIKHK